MRSAKDERGSGGILAMALVAAILIVTATIVPLYIGLAARAAVSAAADTAALAAADVAAGISPGDPCAIAASVAEANTARLDGCLVDGLVVTVRTRSSFLGIPLVAIATAGPPALGTN